MAKGWPACLRTVAAIALLIPEATKLTLGQDLVVYSPHNVTGLLASKGNLWLTDNRLLKYQTLLLEGPAVQIKTCSSLNPATFLPEEIGTPEHDCEQVVLQTYAAREDLRETPLENPDWVLFTDGSSFVEHGVRRAGYAVVTLAETIESSPLPPGTSAQLAELIALTRALELSKDKRANIFTDSKYAYLVLHAHAAIWRERHFLTANGTQVKYHKEIDRLLTSVFLPCEVAVIHCKGHQKGTDDIAEGNRLADLAAREAARKTPLEATEAPLIWEGMPPEIQPQYTPEETQWALSRGYSLQPNGWLQSEEGKIHLPASSQWKVLKALHQVFHLGRDKTLQMAQQLFTGKNFLKTVKQVLGACELCLRNNPKNLKLPLSGIQRRGSYPGEDWQLDFTHMPKTRSAQYLLVCVDTFTDWVEAFPCRTEKATEVVRILLSEIIPRFGLPKSIQSDNGPSFKAAVTQGVSKALGIQYNLHCAWRPQSSGKVEKTNEILKRHLKKLSQETHLPWVNLLPMALIRIRNTPTKLGLSPFEKLYGRPFLTNDLVTDQETMDLTRSVVQLAKFQQTLQQLPEKLSRTMGVPKFNPGDLVLIKTFPTNSPSLSESWEGPFTVILSTPSAVKVSGHEAWIHHTRVKAWNSEPPADQSAEDVPEIATDKDYTCEPTQGLRLLFKRASPTDK